MSSTPVSEVIRSRILDSGASFCANDSIAPYITEQDRNRLFDEVKEKVEALLRSLVIDTDKDPNTKETAKRMTKMFLCEVMRGRYEAAPELKLFPNTKKLDEMIVVGPLKVRSMCSHHMVPILGRCWVGVLPGAQLFGISKFSRICEWIMSRPQIQEEATIQLADYIEEKLSPMGVIVVVKAAHMCMQWRGIKDESEMTSSVVRGVFAKNIAAKQEFLELIKI